jgi:YidC/Oxa1 family membrane protein insertase
MLFPEPPAKKPPQTTEQTQQPGAPQPGPSAQSPATPPSPSVPPSATATAPGAPTAAGTGAAAGATREAALRNSTRTPVATPRLEGSIALTGARFDDLALKDYRLTVDPSSPHIVLLSPVGAHNPYFVEFGWVADAPDVKLPANETVWRADRTTVAPGQPATLTWDNGEGLVFTRSIAVDENYMFTVTQRVRSNGSRTLTLRPFALISRTGTPEYEGTYLLHEGGVGVLNGRLEEVSYDDMKDKGGVTNPTKGGWLGITDKYWLVAVVPDPALDVATRFIHFRRQNTDIYQADYLGPPQSLAPGAEIASSGRLFGGAKEVKLLDAYEATGIERFSYAVDWGWFWFLTKPIFYCLEYFKEALFKDTPAGFGLSILLLTVLIKLLFFPLANKSYRAMSRMKTLQPKMMELRERYKDDKARLNQEMMALYKAEGANPMSGCLPLLIQVPVFFALYKVLYVNIEMRHAPFYGWIKDLSAPDPTSIFNLFGLIPWTPPEFLMIGIWPCLMGITMYLQQKLNPAPPDPMQQKLFMMLPVIFTIMLAQFPAGLVIYWAWNNVLSIGQQWLIMRQTAPPPAGKPTKPAKKP